MEMAGAAFCLLTSLATTCKIVSLMDPKYALIAFIIVGDAFVDVIMGKEL